MEIQNECTVHLLDTERSHLHKGSDEILHYSMGIFSKENRSYGSDQHMYITSDDEIQVGDRCIVTDVNGERLVGECTSPGIMPTVRANGTFYQRALTSKIIASTDPDLRRSGDEGIVDIALGTEVYDIQDSYIKSFVKNPVDVVLVQYWDDSDYNPSIYPDIRPKVQDNKIIIGMIKES